MCVYIFIYLNMRKEKNRDGKFIHSRRALVTHGQHGVRLLQSRSSAEDGDSGWALSRTIVVMKTNVRRSPSCHFLRPDRVALFRFAGDESVETRAWMSVEGDLA